MHINCGCCGWQCTTPPAVKLYSPSSVSGTPGTAAQLLSPGATCSVWDPLTNTANYIMVQLTQQLFNSLVNTLLCVMSR